jgi:hypothetical protein
MSKSFGRLKDAIFQSLLAGLKKNPASISTALSFASAGPLYFPNPEVIESASYLL